MSPGRVGIAQGPGGSIGFYSTNSNVPRPFRPRGGSSNKKNKNTNLNVGPTEEEVAEAERVRKEEEQRRIDAEKKFAQDQAKIKQGRLFGSNLPTVEPNRITTANQGGTVNSQPRSFLGGLFSSVKNRSFKPLNDVNAIENKIQRPDLFTTGRGTQITNPDLQPADFRNINNLSPGQRQIALDLTTGVDPNFVGTPRNVVGPRIVERNQKKAQAQLDLEITERAKQLQDRINTEGYSVSQAERDLEDYANTRRSAIEGQFNANIDQDLNSFNSRKRNAQDLLAPGSFGAKTGFGDLSRSVVLGAGETAISFTPIGRVGLGALGVASGQRDIVKGFTRNDATLLERGGDIGLGVAKIGLGFAGVKQTLGPRGSIKTSIAKDRLKDINELGTLRRSNKVNELRFNLGDYSLAQGKAFGKPITFTSVSKTVSPTESNVLGVVRRPIGRIVDDSIVGRYAEQGEEIIISTGKATRLARENLPGNRVKFLDSFNERKVFSVRKFGDEVTVTRLNPRDNILTGGLARQGSNNKVGFQYGSTLRKARDTTQFGAINEFGEFGKAKKYNLIDQDLASRKNVRDYSQFNDQFRTLSFSLAKPEADKGFGFVSRGTSKRQITQQRVDSETSLLSGISKRAEGRINNKQIGKSVSLPQFGTTLQTNTRSSNSFSGLRLRDNTTTFVQPRSGTSSAFLPLSLNKQKPKTKEYGFSVTGLGSSVINNFKQASGQQQGLKINQVNLLANPLGNINPNPPRTPRFNRPSVNPRFPEPRISAFPKISFGDRGGGGLFKVGKQNFRYAASFTSEILNLRGGRQPRLLAGGFSPFELRRIGARRRRKSKK